MNKIEFITLMSFPMEWLDLDMYPDLLFLKQLNGYEVGHEDSSDHDRNGAFHWWLKKKPSKDELMKLVRLALIDPDQFLSEDIIRYIKSHHTLIVMSMPLSKSYVMKKRSKRGEPVEACIVTSR
ncbi:hypothetical protein FYV85_19000 [Salmonella enterica subsp. enterica]|uniref:hypothetical protein n=1 Tax=Salmonella enterica TaxID=28901 RepID=UPI0013FE3EF1|nr:hypothetical protein [Salmonella enterica]EIB1036805.1 hypothetical protein [Salmonella enterica]NHJ78053.1 hypothetical protein [Salmonella enterica subsp. enterica]NHK19523.1 hypothetical protein [Salmonella enterica subsp. enterica]